MAFLPSPNAAHENISTVQILTLLPIQPSIDRTQHDFENTIAGELRAPGAGKGHRIHNVAELIIA